MHDVPLAQMDEEEGQAAAVAAMGNSVRDLALNTSAAPNGHLGAPRSPSIHMRNAMNRNDGAMTPFGPTNVPPNTLDVERVHC